MNDTKMNNKNQKNSFSLPIGMCLGLSIGTAVGAATQNIGTWLPIGLCLGVALGTAFSSSDDSEDFKSDGKE